MIDNIKEKEGEVKEMWLEKRGKMKPSQFYKEFLGDYFDIASWGVRNADWLFFLNWFRMWEKEIRNREKDEEIEARMRGLTDEEAELAQSRNRKK